MIINQKRVGLHSLISKLWPPMSRTCLVLKLVPPTQNHPEATHFGQMIDFFALVAEFFEKTSLRKKSREF